MLIRVFKIVGYLFLVVIILILLLFALINFSPIQQKIKNYAITEVTKITKNNITIDNFILIPFNSVIIRGLVIEDLSRDTLFQAESLSVRFSLLPLLKNKLEIQSIDFDNFQVKVRADSVNAPLNFMFLIEAFNSEEENKPNENTPSPFTINIQRISLTDGHLKYDIFSEPKMEEGFDVNHIGINDFNANLSLSIINDTINVHLKHLSFIEQSGLWITNISTEYTLVKEEHILNNMEINTLKSSFKVGFLSYSPENNLILKLKASLSPSDFRMFYDPLINMNDILNINIDAKFVNKKLHISTFDVNYNNNIRLNAEAIVNNLSASNLSFDLRLKDIRINRKGLEEVSIFGLERSMINTLPPIIRMKGEVEGSLNRFNLGLELNTDTDNLSLSGWAGYKILSEESEFNLFVSSSRIYLSKWIENIKGKPSRFSGTIRGKIIPHHAPQILCEMQFPLFHYNSYDYKGLRLKANYNANQFEAEIKSQDSLAKFSLYTKGLLNDDKTNIHLDLDVEKFQLDTLNFLPHDKHVCLNLKMQADLNGINPDRMALNLSIDSISLHSNFGLYKDQLTLLYQSNMLDKIVKIRSNIFDIDAKGNFSFVTIAENVKNTLAEYYPKFLHPSSSSTHSNDSIDLKIVVKNIQDLTKSLDIPLSLEEPIEIKAGYNQRGIAFSTNIQEIKYNELEIKNLIANIFTRDTSLFMDIAVQQKIDTSFLRYILNVESLNDSLLFTFDVSKSDTVKALSGNMKFGAKIHSTSPPEVDIHIFSSRIRLNDQYFKLLPAEFQIRDNEYTVSNFEFSYSDQEYIKLNGKISEKVQDSMLIEISQLQIPTILTAIGANTNFLGEINGTIILNQLMDAPKLITNDFSITKMKMDTTTIGDFYLVSKWDTRQQALLIESKLIKPNTETSYITGEVFPNQDSLNLDVKIKEFDLLWLSPYTAGILNGLAGNFGFNIQARGKISHPEISGSIIFNKISMGVDMTQCRYSIDDTIFIRENQINFNNFKITDNFGRNLLINGEILDIDDLKLGLKINFNDFNVLNNLSHTDSLFYGLLRITGNATISKNSDGYFANIALANGSRSRILVNLPDNATQANDYSSVVFISHQNNDSILQENATTPEAKLPFKMRLSLDITPDLTLGAVINKTSNDMATVKGSGKIDLNYDMVTGNQLINGEYTIHEGQASISVIGLTRKTFTIQPQGTIIFKGDPSKTEFDITAIYSLRADLLTLDPSFAADINLSSTRVDVNCKINVKGNADKIQLEYNVEVPNVDESVQRKVASLINSDEIKIRQIAYLLALGTFFPPATKANPNVGNNLWNSLASSSLTAQLNNLLSGVLKENWTVGTEIRSTNNASTAMDVSISTRLLDDRLTLKTNIGINNTGNAANSGSFTGDFDARYKLSKSGTWVVNMYNLTNEQFFRQARTTQGVGVIYRRESQLFNDLFKGIKKKKSEDVEKKEKKGRKNKNKKVYTE